MEIEINLLQKVLNSLKPASYICNELEPACAEEGEVAIMLQQCIMEELAPARTIGAWIRRENGQTWESPGDIYMVRVYFLTFLISLLKGDDIADTNTTWMASSGFTLANGVHKRILSCVNS